MLESVKMLVPQKKRQAWYGFDRRPKHFHLAERLTKCSNDAQEWRKPEISAHTGHKIDNAIGKAVLAKRLITLLLKPVLDKTGLLLQPLVLSWAWTVPFIWDTVTFRSLLLHYLPSL